MRRQQRANQTVTYDVIARLAGNYKRNQVGPRIQVGPRVGHIWLGRFRMKSTCACGVGNMIAVGRLASGITTTAVVVGNSQPIRHQQNWQQKCGGPIEGGFAVHFPIILVKPTKFKLQVPRQGKNLIFLNRIATATSMLP